MTGLADVDGYIVCIQVCMWLGFPPLAMKTRELLPKTNLCHAMEFIKHMIVFVSIIIATETLIPL